ncbi:hypothetical protein CsSME_00040694 [Camellia sinensis var. sinensis]
MSERFGEEEDRNLTAATSILERRHRSMKPNEAAILEGNKADDSGIGFDKRTKILLFLSLEIDEKPCYMDLAVGGEVLVLTRHDTARLRV